jgi:hypothetical protein
MRSKASGYLFVEMLELWGRPTATKVFMHIPPVRDADNRFPLARPKRAAFPLVGWAFTFAPR